MKNKLDGICAKIQKIKEFQRYWKAKSQNYNSGNATPVQTIF